VYVYVCVAGMKNAPLITYIDASVLKIAYLMHTSTPTPTPTHMRTHAHTNSQHEWFRYSRSPISYTHLVIHHTHKLIAGTESVASVLKITILRHTFLHTHTQHHTHTHTRKLTAGTESVASVLKITGGAVLQMTDQLP
jgi:hypothetical protein